MLRIRRCLAVAAACALLSACGQLQPLSTEEALERLNIASTKLYAADGTLIANLHGEINRDIVPLDKIPEHVQQAVIAIEDERFYTHKGVDAQSIARAAMSNLSAGPGGQVQGGSTLSQQLVKQLYFAKPERTLKRKVAEARVTVQFETQYDKPKILEMYLNTIYLGRGQYGMQTAARSYFHKEAADLSLGEAAFLAGIIHEPGNYEFSDSDPPERRQARLESALKRRAIVLAKMRELGFISASDESAANGEELKILPKGEEEWKYPYFVDMVLRQLGVLKSSKTTPLDPRYTFLGETTDERAKNLYRGGLRIYTTLDRNAQQAAEEAVAKVLPANLSKLSASLAAVEPQTGFIRALVGGRDYYPDNCDPATPLQERTVACRMAKVNLALGELGGGSGRQPGSSFKPFVLAAALTQGVSLGASFNSAPFSVKYPGGVWKIGNYESSGGGEMNLVEGTVHSVNAVYAHLEIDGVGEGSPLKGASRVAETARHMGVAFPTADELRVKCGVDYGKRGACIPADQIPAIALGAKEVSPLQMASAYGTFANEGVAVQPSSIARVTDANGNVIYEAQPPRQRVLPRNVALGVTSVLQQVFTRGTGVKAKLPRPAAGKTGTAQEWRDAWLAGYVPQLSAAVWVGDPIPQKNKQGKYEIESMVPANGYPFKVTGGSFPAMIWHYFMMKALAEVPVAGFAPPPKELLAFQDFATPGPMGPVPGVIGLTAARAKEVLAEAGFIAAESRCLDRSQPAGTVAQQFPPPGTQWERSKPVQLCVSLTELPDVFPSTRPRPGFTGKVPAVVGESRASAQGSLSQAGYRTSAVRECDPSGASKSGRVWRQSPSAGADLEQGATVTIWYNSAGC